MQDASVRAADASWHALRTERVLHAWCVQGSPSRSCSPEAQAEDPDSPAPAPATAITGPAAGGSATQSKCTPATPAPALTLLGPSLQPQAMAAPGGAAAVDCRALQREWAPSPPSLGKVRSFTTAASAASAADSTDGLVEMGSPRRGVGSHGRQGAPCGAATQPPPATLLVALLLSVGASGYVQCTLRVLTPELAAGEGSGEGSSGSDSDDDPSRGGGQQLDDADGSSNGGDGGSEGDGSGSEDDEGGSGGSAGSRLGGQQDGSGPATGWACSNEPTGSHAADATAASVAHPAATPCGGGSEIVSAAKPAGPEAATATPGSVTPAAPLQAVAVHVAVAVTHSPALLPHAEGGQAVDALCTVVPLARKAQAPGAVLKAERAAAVPAAVAAAGWSGMAKSPTSGTEQQPAGDLGSRGPRHSAMPSGSAEDGAADGGSTTPPCALPAPDTCSGIAAR